MFVNNGKFHLQVSGKFVNMTVAMFCHRNLMNIIVFPEIF